MSEPGQHSAWALFCAVVARLFWFAAAVAGICVAVAFGYGRLVAEGIALIIAMVAHARLEDRLHAAQFAITELQADVQRLRARLIHMEEQDAGPDP